MTDEVAEPEDPTPEVPDPGETTDPEEPGETTEPETPDPGETTEPEEPDTGKNNNGNGNDNGNDGNHKGWYKDGGEPVDANLAAADSEPAEEGTLEASLVLAATGGGNGNNGNQGNGNGNKDKPTGSDIKKTSTVVKQFVVDFSREDYKPLMEQEVNGLTYRYVNSDKARLSVVVQGIENGSSSLLDSRGELHAYYHTDYLGTTDYLTSAVNSKVIAWTSYNEWGEITHNAVLKCGQRELDLVKEYATHDYDAVLDLYYAKARFYDAYNRTFTAQDPILDPSQYDLREYVKEPMALVQYLYVRDNAVNQVDLLGLEYENITVSVGKNNMPAKVIGITPYVSLRNISQVYGFVLPQKPNDYKQYTASNSLWQLTFNPSQKSVSISRGTISTTASMSTVNIDGTNFVDAEYFVKMMCEVGYSRKTFKGPLIQPSTVKNNDWLSLYTSQTVAGGRFVSIPSDMPNPNYWFAYEGQKNINYYAGLEIGNTNEVNVSETGVITDKDGRYWVAVGPKVINPNFKAGPGGVMAGDMKYGTKLDFILEGPDGKEYYLPGVVGDAKNHTYPNGIYQTGYSWAAGHKFEGSKDGSVVEFIGKNQNNNPALQEYKITGIIVYD